MVPDGVAAAAWSPDQELLAVVTLARNFVMLNKDFDPVVETAISGSGFGAAAPVNVGWGKVETQFQGAAGKLAQQPPPAVLPAGRVQGDDGSPRLAWRGDGDYVVLSTLDSDAADGRRVLRVWNRDSVLQATGEAVPGLEAPLAWRPAGNLIASTQRRPNRHDVVFFERNGLRHGEFTLPFGPAEAQVRHGPCCCWFF